MVGEVVGAAVVEILLGKGIGKAGSILEKTKTGAELLEKAKLLKSATTAKIAEAFSDEAAQLAKQKFANRLKELNLSPNSITNIAADPELWTRATQVAGNTIGKGYTKFADFSVQVKKALGDVGDAALKKLYRESLVSLDLNKGRQILSSGGKVIDEAIVREAKETVFDLVKNNKPLELEEFLEGKNGIRNKYGAEFVDELNQTRAKFVNNLSETTRRTIDTHDLLGGHIREEHIGRSETWLRNRLNKPEMRNENFASSFYNESTANRALGKFVKEHKAEIDAFLKDSRRLKTNVTFDFGETAGIVVERGKTGSKVTNKVLVVLVKDNSETGWHFLTAFPKLK